MKKIVNRIISLVLAMATLLSISSCSILEGFESDNTDGGGSADPHPNATRPDATDEDSSVG